MSVRCPLPAGESWPFLARRRCGRVLCGVDARDRPGFGGGTDLRRQRLRLYSHVRQPQGLRRDGQNRKPGANDVFHAHRGFTVQELGAPCSTHRSIVWRHVERNAAIRHYRESLIRVCGNPCFTSANRSSPAPVRAYACAIRSGRRDRQSACPEWVEVRRDIGIAGAYCPAPGTWTALPGRAVAEAAQ